MRSSPPLPPPLQFTTPPPLSGFQKHVQQPYVMFTTLRNPLELFVSGQQYLNRKASKHFDHVRSTIFSWQSSPSTSSSLKTLPMRCAHLRVHSLCCVLCSPQGASTLPPTNMRMKEAYDVRNFQGRLLWTRSFGARWFFSIGRSQCPSCSTVFLKRRRLQCPAYRRLCSSSRKTPSLCEETEDLPASIPPPGLSLLPVV